MGGIPFRTHTGGLRLQACACMGAAALRLVSTLALGAPSWELFPTPAGQYVYAACGIEEGMHHLWWCQNRDPGQVTDYIAYRRFEFDRGAWTPVEWALAPGAEGQWDSAHVCDPTVASGRFRHGASEFRWVMAYLGCDTRTNQHNQVGLAFAEAPEGPWVRYAGNPVVAGSNSSWGAGQPSLLSLDEGGRVGLFFTRQEDDLSTHTWFQEADLSGLSAPRFGVPVRLTEAGLTERGPARPVLHDADFALSQDRRQVYVVRPLAAGDLNLPGQVVRLPSVVQIARGEWEAIRRGGGEWTVLAEIGPGETGFAFAHSPSFGRDRYGRLPAGSGRVRLNLAVASRVRDPLWTYTLHGVLVELP